jgi:hypothetical protein
MKIHGKQVGNDSSLKKNGTACWRTLMTISGIFLKNIYICTYVKAYLGIIITLEIYF